MINTDPSYFTTAKMLVIFWMQYKQNLNFDIVQTASRLSNNKLFWITYHKNIVYKNSIEHNVKFQKITEKKNYSDEKWIPYELQNISNITFIAEMTAINLLDTAQCKYNDKQ